MKFKEMLIISLIVLTSSSLGTIAYWAFKAQLERREEFSRRREKISKDMKYLEEELTPERLDKLYAGEAIGISSVLKQVVESKPHIVLDVGVVFDISGFQEAKEIWSREDHSYSRYAVEVLMRNHEMQCGLTFDQLEKFFKDSCVEFRVK